jgi:hypothetical protein
LLVQSMDPTVAIAETAVEVQQPLLCMEACPAVCLLCASGHFWLAWYGSADQGTAICGVDQHGLKSALCVQARIWSMQPGFTQS